MCTMWSVMCGPRSAIRRSPRFFFCKCLVLTITLLASSTILVGGFTLALLTGALALLTGAFLPPVFAFVFLR